MTAILATSSARATRLDGLADTNQSTGRATADEERLNVLKESSGEGVADEVAKQSRK